MLISGRIVALLTASIVCVATLPACGLFTSSSSPDTSCDWLRTTKPANDAGHTVVLMDRSGSTWASGPSGPDYVAAAEDVIKSAVDTHDVVFIGTFDGSASSVQWTAEKAVTDRGRTNPDNRRTDDQQAKTCLNEDLQKASNGQARATGTDILGALAVGGQVLHDAAGVRKIVLAADGLATTGCADLTRVSIGDPTAIDQIGQLCRQRAIGLPDLSGISVTLIGVGHPADGQPLPSTLQLGWIALQGLLDELTAQASRRIDQAWVGILKRRHEHGLAGQVAPPFTYVPPPDRALGDGAGRTTIIRTPLFVGIAEPPLLLEPIHSASQMLRDGEVLAARARLHDLLTALSSQCANQG